MKSENQFNKGIFKVKNKLFTSPTLNENLPACELNQIAQLIMRKTEYSWTRLLVWLVCWYRLMYRRTEGHFSLLLYIPLPRNSCKNISCFMRIKRHHDLNPLHVTLDIQEQAWSAIEHSAPWSINKWSWRLTYRANIIHVNWRRAAAMETWLYLA